MLLDRALLPFLRRSPPAAGDSDRPRQLRREAPRRGAGAPPPAWRAGTTGRPGPLASLRSARAGRNHPHPAQDGRAIAPTQARDGDLLKILLRSDEALYRKVRFALKQGHASSVRASVHEGVVGLEGRLPIGAQADEIERAVERIAGVVSVESEDCYLQTSGGGCSLVTKTGLPRRRSACGKVPMTRSSIPLSSCRPATIRSASISSA